MEKLIIIFSLIYSITVFSAINQHTHNEQLNKIMRDINNLEKDLNSSNAKLITIIKKKNVLNQELSRSVENFNQTEQAISLQISEINQILKKLILTKQNVGHTAGSLVSSDLMVKKFNEQKVILNEQLSKNVIVKNEYIDLQKQINEYTKMESDISELINRLEENKKIMAGEYLSLESQGNVLKKEAAIKKAKKLLKSSSIDKSIGAFRPPIDNFIEFEKKDNKGITFTFTEVQPLKTSRSGKILYAGDISPYGNVIMIAHEDNIQSVLLGEITPKVSKGDLLKADEVIGYTKVQSGSKAKLYFEIRKNNKAIDTTNYLDQTSANL